MLQRLRGDGQEIDDWYGKVIGALLGAFVGRGWFGALSASSRSPVRSCARRPRGRPAGADAQVLSAAFFRATFQVMGHVAKADGRVSEQEIAAARAVMRRFSLGEARCAARDRALHRGKRPDFPLETTLHELRRLCGRRADLCRDVRADPARGGAAGRRARRRCRDRCSQRDRARRSASPRYEFALDGGDAAHAAQVVRVGAERAVRRRRTSAHRRGVRGARRGGSRRPTPRSRRPIAG